MHDWLRGRSRNGGTTAYRDAVGSWSDDAFEQIHKIKGQRYSDYDLILRGQYRLALEGETHTIRAILKMLDANIAERKYQLRDTPGEMYWSPDPVVRPGNADPALLILGICAVDNKTLDRVGMPGACGHETRMKALDPTCIEQWVVDLALSRPDAPPLSQPELKYIRHRTRAGEEEDVSKWYGQRAGWIAELVRLRGPGASQFQPGKSGNPRGRPCEKHEEFPYDDFFMEKCTVTVNGKPREMTRLDALMRQFVTKAVKGDNKIVAQVLPRLMELYEIKWRKRFVSAEIIRTGEGVMFEYPINESLIRLGLASKRAKKRLLLEPILVEAALARLGSHRLSRAEQAIVMRAIGSPAKVNWPDWWEVGR